MNNEKVLKVSIVLPVYNEAQNIVKLYQELCKVTDELPYQFEMIFVDDGSRDTSLQELQMLALTDSRVFYVELSKNFGHQYALRAGMELAQGDCVITMDCDLQHPPQVIFQLLEYWRQGYDIVYTRREEDHDNGLFKRKSSSFFYTLMNQLSDLELEKGTADFRLMNRKAVEAFLRFGEHDLFIRGLVKYIGFRQYGITYRPNPRYAGKSKYSVKKMMSLATKGITSFSTKPLMITAYLGFFFFFASLAYLPYALISYINGSAVSGWTSIIMTIVFFGGLQLLMLGIIGLYIGKLVIQAKKRPLYIIRDTNHPLVNSKYAYDA
jgi:polyisoprenyl-phosphate glycosyltransferase